MSNDNAYPNIELETSATTLSFDTVDGVSLSKDPSIIDIFYLGKSDDGTKTYIKVVEGDNVFFGSTTAQFESYIVAANKEVIDYIRFDMVDYY